MTDTDCQRIEEALRVKLPASYHEVLTRRAAEFAKLNGVLPYVVTPWIDAEEIIKANTANPRPRCLLVATNGAGDFWFVHTDESQPGIWIHEHETDEVSKEHNDWADWLAYLEQRAEQDVQEVRLAREREEREFATLTFEHGISSLFTAAQDVKSTARLEALIAAGYDVNTPNENRFAATPIMGATARGNPPAVELLLEAGADSASTDAGGSTALHQCGNAEIAGMLLGAGADPNAINQKGWSPLHGCARFGRAAVLRLLLEHGADKTLCDAEGNTPRDIAVANGKTEVARLLGT